MSEMTTDKMAEVLLLVADKQGRKHEYGTANDLRAIAARLSALDKQLTAATARAEKAEAERDALSKVAHAADREARFLRFHVGEYYNHSKEVVATAERLADAHDAARREAGL